MCVRVLVCGRVRVYLCTSVVYTLVLYACLWERAYLVRRVVGGKCLTFPHSWGHLGHARG